MAKKKHGRPIEWTPERLEKLSEDLLSYVERDDVFHISHFECKKHNKKPGWLNEIASNHSSFYPVLKKAQAILGNKIVTRSMLQGGDKWVIRTFTPMYLKDVKEYNDNELDKDLERKKSLEKYKASLNKTREEEAIAKIEAFNNSQKVAFEFMRMKKFIDEKGLSEELEETHPKPEDYDRITT